MIPLLLALVASASPETVTTTTAAEHAATQLASSPTSTAAVALARTTTSAPPRDDHLRYVFAPLGEPEAEDGDPFRFAPYAAIFEGVGSIGLTAGWVVAARLWDAPYPEGIIGLVTARVLYGTSWTLMLAADVALLRLATGEDWRGVSRGRYRSSWLGGFTVPGRFGAYGNQEGVCGGGIGSFGEVSAAVYRAGPLSIRAAMFGGWIMGRFIEDDLATVSESTWMLAPISFLAEVPIHVGPVTLTLSAGPGLFGGLHDAHAHANQATSAELHIPLTELWVLHGGVGPGVHASASFAFFDVISLEAEAELAALVLHHANEDVPLVVQGLDAFHHAGMPTWRRASFGLGLDLPPLRPLHLAVRYQLAQLSPGPIDDLGHQALGLELAIPIDLDE